MLKKHVSKKRVGAPLKRVQGNHFNIFTVTFVWQTTSMNNNTFFTYATSSKNSSKHVRETKTVNEKEKKERKGRNEFKIIIKSI